MSFLQQFWTWVYIIGLGAFALVAMAVIPLGLRDLVRLMRELGEDRDQGCKRARCGDEPEANGEQHASS